MSKSNHIYELVSGFDDAGLQAGSDIEPHYREKPSKMMVGGICFATVGVTLDAAQLFFDGDITALEDHECLTNEEHEQLAMTLGILVKEGILP